MTSCCRVRSVQLHAQPAPGQAGRQQRRSEVDRRLETLTGPSGRLRDPSAGNIIRVLRLFNLCDVDPLPTQSPPKGAPAGHSTLTRSMPAQQIDPEQAADHPVQADPQLSLSASPDEPAVLQGPEEPSGKLLLEPSAVPQVCAFSMGLCHVAFMLKILIRSCPQGGRVHLSLFLHLI